MVRRLLLLTALGVLGCDARDDIEVYDGIIELDVDELATSIREVDGVRTITIVATEQTSCSASIIEFVTVKLMIDDIDAVPRNSEITLSPDVGNVRATIGYGRDNCALEPTAAAGTVTFTRLGQIAAQGDLDVASSDSTVGGCSGSELSMLWEDFEVPLQLGGCD